MATNNEPIIPDLVDEGTAGTVSVRREYQVGVSRETAQAMIESSRNQFAIPAEQETARARQETVRYAIRVGAVLGIAGAILWMIWQLIERGTDIKIILGLIAAVTVLVGVLGADLPELWKQAKRAGKAVATGGGDPT